jgi:hypothetical protein
MPKFELHNYLAKPVDFQPLEINHIEDPENDVSYNPFALHNIQSYNPLYPVLFSLPPAEYNDVALNHQYSLVNMNRVQHQETGTYHDRPVFIKYSPLLDPVRFMSGKYESHKEFIGLLPSVPDPENLHPKVGCPNNSAYTDALFNFLSSTILHTHQFVNCIDYYGSFLAVQDKFKVNITDDVDYLLSSTHFKAQEGKLFQVANVDLKHTDNTGSRMNKQRLHISTTPKHNITAVSIASSHFTSENVADDEIAEILVYENSTKPSRTASSGSGSTASSGSGSTASSGSGDDSNSDISCSSDEGENWEDVSDTSSVETDSSTESIEPQVYAYLHQFPVQLICQEKCDGTIDELFETEKLDCDESLAAMFQIIMTLTCLQRAFHFTHNDLHTNNIMYVHTHLKFLYYKFENTTYRVPTFGRIFKIIDFGRSIYRYRKQTFCSDSFAPNGDAHTQYNCEPYLSDDKPRLDPNYSFDLCRLGCSIFDFIMEVDDNVDELDDFQRTILRWCSDDTHKNILYKKNGDERYPHFKLYKMIARNVHAHVPSDQLAFPEFKQYALTKKEVLKLSKQTEIMNIDVIPCYA